MIFPKINFENKSTILQSFDVIADKIGKDICIKINKASYRIVEFEFYSYSNSLPDPHTYKSPLQLESNKLNLHSSGMDITFGDGVNYVGILLRSIVKLHDGAGPDSGFMKKQLIGPQVVATELLSNLNNLDSFEPNLIELEDINGHNMDALFCLPKKIVKTKRIGLTFKPGDKENIYKDLPLRYIIMLPRFKEFKQVIRGIESILEQYVLKGELTHSEAKELLGYKKTFRMEKDSNKKKLSLWWDGYCPESYLKGKTIRMRLNRNDFYESEETGLQMCILSGVQAIILNFRGNREFRKTLNYADEIKDGEYLSPQTTTVPPFNNGEVFQSSDEVDEFIKSIK